jgi:hypothetical protein
MPPSASQDTAPPARAAWLAGPARSFRKLIGHDADARPVGTGSRRPRPDQKSRRPVWE